MKKIIILIPVFNDWESLIKLLNEINQNIKDIKNCNFNCIIINDSSTVKQPKIFKPSEIKSLKIINMKNNKGHARCNAFAIRYIDINEKFDYAILMDGDGEDRPLEIKGLVQEIKKDPNTSVVAKRIKRSEGPIFQLMYQIHKFITFTFTGKRINFGNYSCLTKEDIKILFDKESLWSSFSGTVKKNINRLNEIESTRGTRYFGPSKMSLFNLVIHSFSIIAVFKYQVFLRSSFLIILISYLGIFLQINVEILQILLVIFNMLIFIISLREDKKALLSSHQDIKDLVNITH